MIFEIEYDLAKAVIPDDQKPRYKNIPIRKEETLDMEDMTWKTLGWKYDMEDIVYNLVQARGSRQDFRQKMGEQKLQRSRAYALRKAAKGRQDFLKKRGYRAYIQRAQRLKSIQRLPVQDEEQSIQNETPAGGCCIIG